MGEDPTGYLRGDHHMVIITESAQPELRVTKVVKDGETIEWDIDVAEELKAAGRERK